MSGVMVDRDFVRVGDKSFAINKINSVEVRTRTIKGSVGYIALWLLAFLLGLTLVGSLDNPDSSTGALAVFVAILVGCGALSWRKRHSTAEYDLFLVTSSGEAAAMKSSDRDAVMGTREEIERAMIARGL